jgi:hypothetical protein
MAFQETQDHIMYNMCAKFHQNPCINLGGVGGANLCLRTDRQTDYSIPRNFVAGGIIQHFLFQCTYEINVWLKSTLLTAYKSD